MQISKNGFKTVTGKDGSIKLLFDSERAKECSEFAVKNRIEIISLYPGVYKAKDLAPILSNPNRTIGQTFLGAERNLLNNYGLWP